MFTSVTRTLVGAVLWAGVSTTQASIGAQTAEQMQKNYDAAPAYCPGNAVPAHACSGVLLRSTKPSPLYHTWHHSQNTKDKGGVSFSYLRSDIPTTQLAADGRSGFTLYPLLQRPQNSLRYEMLCAWPTDGDSWERGNRGCGDNRQTAATEAACHELGVHTAEQWIEAFRQSADYKAQCAFDIRRTRVPERAEAFNQSVRVKQLFAPELPFPWNEVMLGAWDEAHASNLPIQSFFHIEGAYGALQQAQADQEDWHRTNGTFIPVIRIRLPNNLDERAAFSYHESDQAVALP